MIRLLLSWVLTLAVWAHTAPAHAIIIEYEAIDLSDTIVGQDRWQYAYYVSDFVFPQDYGFTVIFDFSFYSDIQPVGQPADWDVLVVQPEPLFPDGFYDALALVNNAPLSAPFVTNFTWLGLGAPASQFFEVYDDSFAVVTAGNTVARSPGPPAMPEPGSLLLLAAGVLALAVVNRRIVSQIGSPSNRT